MEWKSIETAPKGEGRYVIVYDDGVYIATLDEYGWCPAFGDERQIQLNPTHWMPLPKKPKE